MYFKNIFHSYFLLLHKWIEPVYRYFERTLARGWIVDTLSLVVWSFVHCSKTELLYVKPSFVVKIEA